MNVELLKKVADEILARPEQFRMESWFTPKLDSIPECGTACCIAGWAITIATDARIEGKFAPLVARRGFSFGDAGPVSSCSAHVAAQKALDLTSAQAELLFYTYEWPPRFRDAYIESRNSTTRADVAFARIMHFIKTDGKE
jgi:hypothetical protein